MKNQVHHKDFAILYRTNAQSRALEEALENKTSLIKFMEDFHSTKEKK